MCLRDRLLALAAAAGSRRVLQYSVVDLMPCQKVDVGSPTGPFGVCLSQDGQSARTAEEIASSVCAPIN